MNRIKFPYAKLSEAYEYYASGKTLQQTADKFGRVSRELIRWIFNKYNLPMRGKQGAAELRRSRNKCRRGHFQTNENFGREKNGTAFCKKCREIRSKGENLKKFCKRGHRLDKDNIYIAKRYRAKGVQRLCRRCTKDRQARYYRRKRGKK